jgi:hypothetical protein
MGTETFSKAGQVSKKKHSAKKNGKEHYMGQFEEPPTFGDGPDYFDRKYMKKYKKKSLMEQAEFERGRFGF